MLCSKSYFNAAFTLEGQEADLFPAEFPGVLLLWMQDLISGAMQFTHFLWLRRWKTMTLKWWIRPGKNPLHFFEVRDDSEKNLPGPRNMTASKIGNDVIFFTKTTPMNTDDNLSFFWKSYGDRFSVSLLVKAYSMHNFRSWWPGKIQSSHTCALSRSFPRNLHLRH